MANVSQTTDLTPEEVKEIQEYLKEKHVDIQFSFAPQNVRRMEDGGLVIDPPQITTRLVRTKEHLTNGKVESV